MNKIIITIGILSGFSCQPNTRKVENGLVHVVHTMSKDDMYYTQTEFNKLFKLLK